MNDTIKFTEEEMKSIQAVQQEYQSMVVQFGQIRLDRILLEQRTKQIEEVETQVGVAFEKLQQRERELVKSLNEKYGPGSLNPQTGEFTPAPQVS